MAAESTDRRVHETKIRGLARRCARKGFCCWSHAQSNYLPVKSEEIACHTQRMRMASTHLVESRFFWLAKLLECVQGCQGSQRYVWEAK